MDTVRVLLTLLIGLGSVSAALAVDDSRRPRFATDLSGYSEVHFITTTPTAAIRGAVSTPATGKFKMRIDDRKVVSRDWWKMTGPHVPVR